jgi:hypothetical protein
MSVPANMTAEMEARQRTVTFLEDMAAAVGLLVLGFPLTPATITGNPTRLDFGRRLHHAIQVRTLSDRADMHTKTLS